MKISTSWRRWFWGTFLVLGSGVILTLIVWPRPGEPVTRELLGKAFELWARASIRDYDLDLQMSGGQTGRYAIEVRDGKISRISRDGVPATPHEDFYSVDGLFRTIRAELGNAENETYGKGARVWMRLQTDPHLGYPVKYIRQVSGTTMNITIEVKKFERR